MYGDFGGGCGLGFWFAVTRVFLIQGQSLSLCSGFPMNFLTVLTEHLLSGIYLWEVFTHVAIERQRQIFSFHELLKVEHVYRLDMAIFFG